MILLLTPLFACYPPDTRETSGPSLLILYSIIRSGSPLCLKQEQTRSAND